LLPVVVFEGLTATPSFLHFTHKVVASSATFLFVAIHPLVYSLAVLVTALTLGCFDILVGVKKPERSQLRSGFFTEASGTLDAI
jgi:hypothetical protein